MKKTIVGTLALGLSLALSGAAFAQVKIGIGAPLTGPNAAVGDQFQNGVEQAVADLNAAGGILGEKIEVSLGDDTSDPKQGVSVANKFAGEGVKFVVGHYNSGVSIPASETYEEAGILQISPGSTNPVFTERGLWNTFRTCGRDDQQGAVAGEYLAKHYNGKNIAVVHDKTPYGKGLADETVKALQAKGLKAVVYEGVNTGEKDYSALVSKLKAANVDVVYFGGLYTEAGLITRQMRDQGLSAPLMGGDGIASSEYAAIAGPGAAGTLMTFSPDPRKNPAAQQVVEKFKAKNFDPETYTLYSYAAVQVLAQAAEEAKSLDPEKVAETIRSGKAFKTVIGDLSFNEKGDITRPDYIVYEWRKTADGNVGYSGNEVE
ncbi:branched-chain amino acid transport system substrate-binding protein [Pseudochelatococcus lubricantis]|uniref:Branched-chain amino acid transport system substrate-binding protein n=1 Tax=Pseudochelatococcus lubricantis TaxID=1538102 RepID=A0ABX0UX13_9HYPH|nr:branched-chain amino acid ABC transporter substrate-binding protein [Pseudochelatococcus lubricantis]NIJ56819.1 branched-chain amino acid transport system substrate-binding protein [Pseudochelatococcus lubricantis]